MENVGGESVPPEEPASAKALSLLVPDRKPECWEWQVAGVAGRGRV